MASLHACLSGTAPVFFPVHSSKSEGCSSYLLRMSERDSSGHYRTELPLGGVIAIRYYANQADGLLRRRQAPQFRISDTISRRWLRYSGIAETFKSVLRQWKRIACYNRVDQPVLGSRPGPLLTHIQRHVRHCMLLSLPRTAQWLTSRNDVVHHVACELSDADSSNFSHERGDLA